MVHKAKESMFNGPNESIGIISYQIQISDKICNLQNKT